MSDGDSSGNRRSGEHAMSDPTPERGATSAGPRVSPGAVRWCATWPICRKVSGVAAAPTLRFTSCLPGTIRGLTMANRYPHRSGTGSNGRSRPSRSYRRSFWRLRDLIVLGGLGLIGLGSVSSWLGLRSDPSEQQASSFLGGSGAYYRYCRHARAAGAAPLRAGEPGYRPHPIIAPHNKGVTMPRMP